MQVIEANAGAKLQLKSDTGFEPSGKPFPQGFAGSNPVRSIYQRALNEHLNVSGSVGYFDMRQMFSISKRQ